jgi:hypothetical protein
MAFFMGTSVKTPNLTYSIIAGKAAFKLGRSHMVPFISKAHHNRLRKLSWQSTDKMTFVSATERRNVMPQPTCRKQYGKDYFPGIGKEHNYSETEVVLGRQRQI